MPLSVLYGLYTNGPTGAHGLPIDLPQFLMYSQFWPLPKPTGYWISGPYLSMSIDQLHSPEFSSSQHTVAWWWLHAAHGHACTVTYIISKLPDLLCSVYPHWMRKCFLHFNDLYIPYFPAILNPTKSWNAEWTRTWRAELIADFHSCGATALPSNQSIGTWVRHSCIVAPGSNSKDFQDFGLFCCL